MIRFVRPVAALAVTLVVAIGCAGATPVATPTAEPDQTEDVSTFAPTTTPAVVVTTPAGPAASTLDFGTDLPTTVTITLSSGRFIGEFAEGTFTSSATARQCGPDFVSPRGFGFGFPKDIDPHDVEDVTFGAVELLPGTSTSSFGISANISPAAAGGAHPLTALDTDDPHTPATGTAQLSVAADGTRTLVVDAADQDGVSIKLTAVCSPI